MNSQILTLCVTAASIGFFHTLFGPDHYVPFIVMSKARKWSLVKTVVLTVLCGIGHIIGSIVLGFIGIALSMQVMKLEAFEAFRGNLAAWGLIGFGLAYFIYGVHSAIKNKPHKHIHYHDDEGFHTHKHIHTQEHAHLHKEEKANVTPWILFVIFILGPCEPLIPLLMYPAAKNSFWGVFFVAGVFGITTIITMTGIVVASSYGVQFISLKWFERYTHALAGFAIFACGFAVQFLGL